MANHQAVDEIAVVDSDDVFAWFKGRPVRETKRAFAFLLRGGLVWIPKSRLLDDRESHCIPRWLADTKGFPNLKPRTPIDSANLPRFDAYNGDGGYHG